MSKPSSSSIPVELIRKHLVYPFNEGSSSVSVYSPNHLKDDVKNELEFVSGKTLTVFVKDPDEVRDLIEKKYRLGGTIAELSRAGQNGTASKNGSAEAEPSAESQGPQSTQVQILDFIIEDALKKRSTDIHFERAKKHARLRFRIDGVLINQEAFDLAYYESIISRIKILSHLDIGERRLPQDGKFSYKNYDIRVSVLPGLFGEGVVLRILSSDVKELKLEELGFYPESIELIKEILLKPSGLVLINGPTGSGKNTTLYAMLQLLDSVEKKVVTVEDPVEYIHDEYFQIQVKPEIGLNFARGLRSVLRSDPDVLLVGEIRDKETGEIAVEFSNTGHLVFSTVHSNDNLGAIRRLIGDMGVNATSVAESLRLVISQRLVRKVCAHCSAKEDSQMVGKGCRECHGTGYFGRTAVYEVLKIDEVIREKIRNCGIRVEDLLESLKRQKGSPMGEIAKRKISDGVTNSLEILKTI